MGILLSGISTPHAVQDVSILMAWRKERAPHIRMEFLQDLRI